MITKVILICEKLTIGSKSVSTSWEKLGQDFMEEDRV